MNVNSLIYNASFTSSSLQTANLNSTLQLANTQQLTLASDSISSQVAASLRLSTDFNLLASTSGFQSYSNIGDILATAYPNNISAIDEYI